MKLSEITFHFSTQDNITAMALRHGNNEDTITEMTERQTSIPQKQFQALLEEAVLVKSYRGVEMLLEHESMVNCIEAEKDPNIYNQKSTMPLVLAAQKSNFQMIKLFLKYQYSIPFPHVTNCPCDKCQSDKLGQTKYRLTLLKALSNPVWISLTADNIFLTIFRLHYVTNLLRTQDDSFEKEYDTILEANENLSLSLLDEVQSEKGGILLMRYKPIFRGGHRCKCDLSFIKLAVEYKQKKVVTHPVIQHFLTSRVFDDIPAWRTSGIVYKMFFTLLVAALFPITTLLNIILPSKCCASLARIAMQPYVKFVNGAASFITFLVLLGVVGISERNGVRAGVSPTGIDIAVLIWLIGFCVGECKQVIRRGITRYLQDGWNWVDIGMDLCMSFAIITWIVLSYHQHRSDSIVHQTVMYIADGAFAVAIILSFFRIIYLCQITCYLGLLQMCLGEMIMVILQFAFISVVVLVSFTIAMSFLYHASSGNRAVHAKYETKNVNRSSIYRTLTEEFNGFGATLFTMGWLSAGMKDISTLDGFGDGTLIHLWANLLYFVYYGITMIIVLNMLIAMMNNSYQLIADNLATEHKYSRTTLWLEYIGDEQTRPVPFNLIPNAGTFRKLFSCIDKKCSTEGSQRNETLKKEAKKKYRRLCDVLMDRYILKTYGFSVSSGTRENNEEVDENDPFLQKVRINIEQWRNPQGVCPIDGDDELAAEGADNFGYTVDSLGGSIQLSIEDAPVWNEFLIL